MRKGASIRTKGGSSLIARSGFFVAVTAGLAALLSGLGSRSGLWDYRTGISVLRWASYGGISG
ncbi:MAG TPA: hypothetical protein VMH06_01005, partial [Thermodesulfovibrionales bacterium]|nr:hypothetical protein [Thermodesulfovibrionales bacterium]